MLVTSSNLIRQVTLLALAAGIYASSSAAAQAQTSTWVINSSESPVTFLAIGKPGFLKIRGEGAQLSGRATVAGGKLTGAFEVALDKLETGIDLRDRHMKDTYLETAKHPKASLVLDETPVDLTKGMQETAFTGKLTLKGVEKPVKGELVIEPSGDQVTKGDGKLAIKLADYPVGVPSHLGVSVADTVEIELSFVATREGATVGLSQ